jgi:hypothetical protein
MIRPFEFATPLPAGGRSVTVDPSLDAMIREWAGKAMKLAQDYREGRPAAPEDDLTVPACIALGSADALDIRPLTRDYARYCLAEYQTARRAYKAREREQEEADAEADAAVALMGAEW